MRMSRRDRGSRERIEAERTLRDSMGYLEKRRDEAKPFKTPSKANVTKTLLEAAEVSAGAAATGWLAGRMGTTSIVGGIPLGLAIGVAGHAAAMFGLFGDKYDGHISNVANGALAGWLALWGAGQGGQSRANANGGAAPVVAGALPDRVGAAPAYPSPPAPLPPRQMNGFNPFSSQQPLPLSEAELQAMSREMR